jgi:hypothetical protein
MAEGSAQTLQHTQSAVTNILDSYVKTAPCDQNAIDIFAGEWASKFPPPYAHLNAGPNLLFQDVRLAWALERLGVRDQTVLELGPLEGAHSYMLEQAGAASVTAIESNTRAYLKCLVTKETLGLKRTKFWCGDFIPFMETTTGKYDLLIASGVLYHMKEPVRVIEAIARCSTRVYIWTHYFDPAIIEATTLKDRFGPTQTIEVGGKTVTLHRQNYQTTELTTNSFFGGTDAYSVWLTRAGIVDVLNASGFKHIEFNVDLPNHPHGPALSLIATK